jgi:hypothetical protein
MANKLLRISRALVIIAVALVCTRAVAGNDQFPGVYTDPLRWDDLVVQGKVIAIEYATIPGNDWYSPGILKYKPGAQPVDVLCVRIQVSQVAHGVVQGPEVRITYPRFIDAPQQELLFNERVKPGANIIATAGYAPWSKEQWRLRSVFAKSGSDWSQLQEAKWSEPITDLQIRERLASVGLSSATREADLVIKGTVVSHRDVDSSPTRDKEYVIRPDALIKGQVDGNVKLHVLGGLSKDEAKWRTLVPYQLDDGTTWYMFLKRSGDSYLPAAGSRSMLRIEGTNLYENLVVPSKYHARDLEREIRQFTSD